MTRDLLNVASHPWPRRQRPHIAGLKIDPAGTPVFVAGHFAEEHDMPVVVHPDDPGTEIAVGHRGYRARVADPVERSHPEIEHTVDGARNATRLPS
jgi:hypothetical protein